MPRNAPPAALLAALLISLSLAGCMADVGGELALDVNGGELAKQGDPEPGEEYGTFSYSASLPPGSRARVCRAQSGLNQRTGPGTHHKVLWVLPPGAEVKIIGSSGSWYHTEFNGGEAWSHGYYLCRLKDAPPPPPTPSPASTPWLKVIQPANNSTQHNPVRFRVEASGHVRRVTYTAEDKWTFAQSSNHSNQYSVHYSFTHGGHRRISVRGHNLYGQVVAERTINIHLAKQGGNPAGGGPPQGSSGQGSGVCTGTFTNPAPGYPVTSEFGSCRSGCTRRHKGIDLATPIGATVRAANGGNVIFVGWASGYGNVMDINHCGKYTTRYAHLKSFVAQKGQQVSKGQVVARSGNTGVGSGPHLHFEIRHGGPWGKPQNPRNFIKF